MSPIGSPRQYKHPTKPGRVTVAGPPGDDLAPGTWKSILKQSGLKGRSIVRDAVVIEKAERNYSAYLPDVPGCVATGRTPDEARETIATARQMHFAGLREDGLPIPEPATQADDVTAS